MCEMCIHKNVCRFKTELENLKNDIIKVTPAWAPDRYIVTVVCKNYSKAITASRTVANKNLAENYGGV